MAARTRTEPRRAHVVLLTSGHKALDHRVFSKEALSLVGHFADVRVVGVHPRDEVVEGVEIRALKPYRSRAERFLVHPVRCFLAARGPRPRVLVLHDAELLAWVPLVKLVTRWRVIYDVHEDFSNLLTRRTWLPRPLAALARRLGFAEKRLAAMCDGVMAVTQSLVDRFDHPRRVAVYNLPSADFLAEATAASGRAPERDTDLVHLGTLSDERLAFLIDVVRGLEERRPGTRTMLIGLRPEQVERVRNELPGADVETHAQVPYDAIPELLVRCRVGVDVHPVLYPHLECAVPVKVFEYMASGCSVVTSYLPELSRLLADEGGDCVVTVRDPQPGGYADAIARFLADRQLLERCRGSLMEQVEARWTWSTEEPKLIEFVESIAAEAA
jgi:glycosyltransferase involved in cell wall biosynthesis